MGDHRFTKAERDAKAQYILDHRPEINGRFSFMGSKPLVDRLVKETGLSASSVMRIWRRQTYNHLTRSRKEPSGEAD